MKPKSHFLTIVLAISLLGPIAGIPLLAQTIPTNNPTGSFFNTVTEYFTSFNTNLTTFRADKADLWASADFRQGVNTSFSLGGEYNIWKNLDLNAKVSNFGVAGAVTAAQAGIGLRITLWDVRVEPYIAGGNSFTSSSDVDLHGAYIEVGGSIRKAATDHVWYGLAIAIDLALKNTSSHEIKPTLLFQTGVTF